MFAQRVSTYPQLSSIWPSSPDGLFFVPSFLTPLTKIGGVKFTDAAFTCIPSYAMAVICLKRKHHSYHSCPTHATFGGFEKSRFGRGNHKMALVSFQKTENIIQSNTQTKLGFF